MRRAFRHIFCLLLSAAPLWLAAQVQVSAKLDSSYILIGDQVHLELMLSHPSGVQVTEIGWPVVQDVEALEVLDPGSLDTIPSQGGQVVLRQEMLLTSFDSGYHRIPPIPIHFRENGQDGVVESSDLALTVNTFPVGTDTAALAPIKTIMEEPLAFQDLLPYLGGALALILLGGLAWMLLRRRNTKASFAPPEEKRAPHEVALEDLEKLQKEQLWQAGHVKAYYSELTRILRTFLEDRFAVTALESPTGETLAQLDSLDLKGSWRKDLEKVLRTADTVKFAKAIPEEDTHESLWQTSKELVEQIPPEPEPEDVETAESHIADS